MLGQHPCKGCNGNDGFLACLASRLWRESHLLFALCSRPSSSQTQSKLILDSCDQVQFDHTPCFLGMNLCLNQTNKEISIETVHTKGVKYLNKLSILNNLFSPVRI